MDEASAEVKEELFLIPDGNGWVVECDSKGFKAAENDTNNKAESAQSFYHLKEAIKAKKLPEYLNKIKSKKGKRIPLECQLVLAKSLAVHGIYVLPGNGTCTFCDIKTFTEEEENVKKEAHTNITQYERFILLQRAVNDPNLKVRFFGREVAEIGTKRYEDLKENSQQNTDKSRKNLKKKVKKITKTRPIKI